MPDGDTPDDPNINERKEAEPKQETEKTSKKPSEASVKSEEKSAPQQEKEEASKKSDVSSKTSDEKNDSDHENEEKESKKLDKTSAKSEEKSGSDHEKLERASKKPSEASAKKSQEKSTLQKLSEVVAYPLVAKVPPENPDRGNWDNPVEFVLSCLGYAVGLGNVWRFPYIVYKFGGGSFLLAYWILFFLVAFPTFYVEMHLGQFTSTGPVHIFKNMIPAMEGIGWATLGVQLLTSVYYNGLFAYSLFYTFSSMQAHPPWDHCNSAWNSKACFTLTDYNKCMGDNNQSARWYVKGVCYNETTISKLYDMIDGCVQNYQYLPEMQTYNAERKNWNCSLRLRMKFNKDYSPYSFVNISADVVPSLFKRYDACEDMWVDIEGDLSDETSQTLMFDFFHDFKPADMPTHLAKVLRNEGISVKAAILDYCATQEPDLSLVACSRKVMQPMESFSSQEFFNEHLNRPGGSFSDLQGFYWPMPLCLLLAWVVVAVGISKGVTLVGKIVYVTAIFPMVMGIVLVIYSSTMEGHKDGVAFYLKTRWCQLKNPELWLTATGQIFFSLSIGGGGLMTIASYNPFHNDLFRDAIIVALGNCIFSFMVGFGTFGVVGSMAHSVGTEVKDMLRGSSSGIAFVTYAQATAGIKGGPFLAILFFLMLCLLAVDSEFTMAETVVTFFYDEYPALRKRKWKYVVVAIASVCGFLLGLPCVTRTGNVYLGVIDSAAFDFLTPFCCVGELAAIIFFYGIKRFMNDISMMLGVTTEETKHKCKIGRSIWNSPVKYFLAFSWMITSPIGVLLLLILTIATSYAKQEIADPLQGFIFWLIAGGVFPASLIAAFLYNVLYRGRKTKKELLNPTKEWGPAMPQNRLGIYAPEEPENP